MAKASEQAFSGARLRLARIFQGMTQAELGERVSVTHQFIGFLEGGHKQPSKLLVEALGEACDFPSDFFFGPLIDEFRDEDCHFRRRQTTAAIVRAGVLAHGTLFGQLVRFLDANVSLPKVSVPEIRLRSRDDIERAAERCRMQWGLGIDVPIKSMVRALENAGIVVTCFEGGTDKVDAFSRSGGRGVVVLNTDKRSATRRRFDIAHETCHLVAHGGMVTGDEEREREADQFASALLMPRAGLVPEFPRMRRLDWTALFRLKERWGVSVAALVRRAYDLRLLNAMQYQRAYKYMSAQGWRKGEPQEPTPEEPELVRLATDTLAEQGFYAETMAELLTWSTATLARVSGVTMPTRPAPPAGSSGVVIPLARRTG